MLYTLRRGGIALVASAAVLLVLILWSFALSATDKPPVIYVLLNIITYLLLLAGLPAIYAVQPDTVARAERTTTPAPSNTALTSMLPQSVRVKQIGFLCMALGASISVIALLLAIFGVTNLPGVIDWLFLIADVLGYVLVGWLVARGGAFPSWVGWLLFASGLVSVLLGPGYGDLLLIPSLAGFGVVIIRLTQPSAISHPDDATETTEATVEPQA